MLALPSRWIFARLANWDNVTTNAPPGAVTCRSSIPLQRRGPVTAPRRGDNRRGQLGSQTCGLRVSSASVGPYAAGDTSARGCDSLGVDTVLEATVQRLETPFASSSD